MPCCSVSRVSVKLEKMEPELLMEALNERNLAPWRQGDWIYFGRNEQYNVKTGVMNAAQSRDINEIKRAYSVQIVKSQAEKYGWELEQVGEFEYEVRK
jgi:hypothetical protein